MMVLGERDLCFRFRFIFHRMIDYNGKIIRIKRKRNNKSLSPSTINVSNLLPFPVSL